MTSFLLNLQPPKADTQEPLNTRRNRKLSHFEKLCASTRFRFPRASQKTATPANI
jgi:hypothetical protein